jgi:hypothetical protein
MNGRIRLSHRFILAKLLTQIDSLDETLARFDTEVVKYCTPFEPAVELL